MNFLAHARDLTDRPYATAGSGLPDWTRHLTRRARIRPARLPHPVEADDSAHAEILRGVWAHVDDDTWFHQAPAFKKGMKDIATCIRDALAPERVRASFLSHILLEMLLDAALIDRRPDLCDAYYSAMEDVDAKVLAKTARAITPGLDADDDAFQRLLDRFLSARFLADYQDDHTLAHRLSQVARRVNLDALDERFIEVIPACRAVVEANFEGLLQAPSSFVPPSEALRDV